MDEQKRGEPPAAEARRAGPSRRDEGKEGRGGRRKEERGRDECHEGNKRERGKRLTGEVERSPGGEARDDRWWVPDK